MGTAGFKEDRGWVRTTALELSTRALWQAQLGGREKLNLPWGEEVSPEDVGRFYLSGELEGRLEEVRNLVLGLDNYLVGIDGPWGGPQSIFHEESSFPSWIYPWVELEQGLMGRMAVSLNWHFDFRTFVLVSDGVKRLRLTAKFASGKYVEERFFLEVDERRREAMRQIACLWSMFVSMEE